MRIEENQISKLFSRLTGEEQDALIRQLRTIVHSGLSLAPEALAAIPMEQLLDIRDIIQGYVLTKNNVPNIIQDYNALDTSKLHRKIAFGRLQEPPYDAN
ncbi:hypothetical protein [Paenibacillus glycanilyticus]|uniref:Uncharacterized protein n=1 Tax=Paenibacillus glycanilyticus TaxID=126569 RepID=A0ABQ6GIA6_9BACL|nr:hypothetical protein [Paenibacillus glycanilyticus]GLX69336.1 hypothetical protein MU1_36810 [Paenibacillus glycanilyticus]